MADHWRITAWLEVRVLSAPPITHRTAEISWGGAKYPVSGAFRRVDLVSGFLALGLHGRYGRSVSVPQNHFSWETETGLTRDWFESGRLPGCACRRGALTGFYCRGRCGCRSFRASVLRRSQGVRRFWRHWHGNDEQTRQIGYRRPEGRGRRHA
jgi:hypothetical protein